MKRVKALPRISPVVLIFYIFLFACGGFHEYLSAGCSVLLGGVLLYRLIKQGGLSFRLHPTHVMLCALPFLYLAASVWAVDRAYALMGFVKFLPLTFFVPLLSDREADREQLLALLPAAGAAQTVVAAGLMLIPAARELVSVAGRLSGFFQYANAFALFELICLLVLLTKPRFRVWDYVCFAVLAGGILFSGSRTTAVLTLLCVPAAILIGKDKKVKRTALLCFLGLVLLAALYAVLSKDTTVVDRLVRLSFTESTFAGRLLYWKDALRLILRRPFGLGYLGWSFAQFSNQTGVYAVEFVHNDYLQLLLDVGVPGLAVFAAAFCAAFFSKQTDAKKRILLLAFAAHLFMEFDLEFVGLFLLLAALLYTPQGEAKRVEKRALAALPAALLLFSVWLGASHGLYRMKRYDEAFALYPGNTPAAIAVMRKNSGSEKADRLADRLLRRNPYLSAAFDEKAKSALQAGDVRTMAEYRLRQIANSPYTIELYDEYCEMLAVAFGQCRRDGDAEGMLFCKEKMREIPQLLAAVEEKTDPLAYVINDKPTFTLRPESYAYIRQMEDAAIPAQ